MGIWIAKPALDGSEAVMWQHLASRAQSARRDVGILGLDDAVGVIQGAIAWRN